MSSIFSFFRRGLEKTATKIGRTISGMFTGVKAWDASNFEDLEMLLISADFGVAAATRAQSENWDFARLATVDRNVMRVAVFEMLFKDDVPPVVSINEAVEIAMDYSGEKAGSFINGVLNGVKNNLSRSPRESGAAE